MPDAHERSRQHTVEPSPDQIDGLYEIREVRETRVAETTPLPPDSTHLERLKTLIEDHAVAAAAGDLRRVFRLNNAMGNYSRRVHVVRAIAYGDAGHFERVVGQHREMLEAMRSGDRKRYVAAVQAHLPHSRVRYRTIWQVKHGNVDQG